MNHYACPWCLSRDFNLHESACPRTNVDRADWYNGFDQGIMNRHEPKLKPIGNSFQLGLRVGRETRISLEKVLRREATRDRPYEERTLTAWSERETELTKIVIEDRNMQETKLEEAKNPQPQDPAIEWASKQEHVEPKRGRRLKYPRSNEEQRKLF